MISWQDLRSFKAKNPVVTIGIFDGVHRGHHYLLENLRQKAVEYGGETVVVSLWPHPRQVLQNNSQSLRYLLSLEEKKVLLEGAGIDHFVIIPFTLEFSQLESCRFVEEYLVNQLGMKYLLVGFNHKFGKGRRLSKFTFVCRAFWFWNKSARTPRGGWYQDQFQPHPRTAFGR
jgi:riboflavin kinase/FMN adenylyltransferase